MTGDHHDRTARRATLLITAADEILAHKRKQPPFWRSGGVGATCAERAYREFL
jgi:hypothetical protein